MELKTFIENVLIEIAEGITSARDKVGDKIAINPASVDGKDAVERDYINFDIAVTTSETKQKSSNKGKKGSLGIKVISAGINEDVKENKNSGSEKISRVNFRVPVYYAAYFKKK